MHPLKTLQVALNLHLLGKEDVVRLGLTCLLAHGHLLLEDIPGMGKTTFSHALAHLTGMEYRRIQFTSDMLPGDLIGVSIYDSNIKAFQFHQGPLFSQLILADEINRASPKTQSALLEAMEERQVTVDHQTITLPEPFFVIATQNPNWQLGTFPLPESQLDRFLMCLSIGYPSEDAERALLLRQDKLKLDDEPILDKSALLELQKKATCIRIPDLVLDYVQSILKESREAECFIHGLSPRAGQAIIRAAQAYALLNEQDYISIDDIQAILAPVVNHRLKMNNQSASTAAQYLLSQVEVPV